MKRTELGRLPLPGVTRKQTGSMIPVVIPSWCESLLGVGIP